MILHGTSRGGSANLAAHLLKPENDRIEILELKGFVAEDLTGALNEMYAVSRGTPKGCKLFMYSLSLNPPPDADVTTTDFIDAANQVEKKLGLSGQPRALVLHEKNGRCHAHSVWSRVNAGDMKAIPLSFDRMKLKAVSRSLFLDHNWSLPAGLIDKRNRDFRNFTRAEWEQAKRAGRHPRATKDSFRRAWTASDNGAAFRHALEEQGYRLARGDRRGFVAVDIHGEVFSVPRMTGVKTKDVRERLGDPESLPSVAAVKTQIADILIKRVKTFARDLKSEVREHLTGFEARRLALINKQRAERAHLDKRLEQRSRREALARQLQLRTGLAGFWDRLRGERRRMIAVYKREIETGQKRDQADTDALAIRHREQRRDLKQERSEVFGNLREQRDALIADMQELQRLRSEPDHVMRPPRNGGPREPEP